MTTMLTRLLCRLRSTLARFWRFGRQVRLAHAFRSVPTATDTGDMEQVLEILDGRHPLTPRPPAEQAVVSGAEHALGLPNSPIYTFAGCLHPTLGTIGLVISQKCLPRCLQGVSRCDTGGLFGRKGSFKHVSADDVNVALDAMTCANCCWDAAFSVEIAGSYSSDRDYVAGVTPRHDAWRDARSRCITAHLNGDNGAIDRRLWTWEVRLSAPPRPGEYEALVLSPEAFKKLDELHRNGLAVPPHVRIISGRAGPEGVHHFDEGATVDALCGRRSA